MLLKIAWRNILRNKRRSGITILLGIVCTTFLIWYQAINLGSHKKMIRDAVEIYTGYLQIQGAGYNEKPNLDRLIFNENTVLRKLEDHPLIDTITSRFEAFTLFSSNKNSVGGLLVGINPDKETKTSRLKKALTEGTFLNEPNGLYIGEKLAKRLDVQLGDEVVYISSAIDYSMAAEKKKVTGIFKTNLLDFDSQMAFINKKDMDQTFLSENTASHILIRPKSISDTHQIQKDIQAVLDPNMYEVLRWEELLKDFVMFVEIDEAFAYVTAGIVLIVVFFVIMIFNVIAVFQRTRELGIMRAIGTTQGKIFQLLLIESCIFGLISAAIGGVLGSALSYYFQINPIEFKFGEDIMEMYHQFGVVDAVMPTELSLNAVLFGTLTVFCLHILAILYPIWRINKKHPIDAIEGR